MFHKLERSTDRVLGFKCEGKLHHADYEYLVPLVDKALETQPTVRMLFWFHEFTGWDLHSAWDDLKFGVNKYGKFDRIAVVGEETWHEWAAKIAKPFTAAEVRYFPADQLDAAWDWAETGATVSAI